MQSTHRTYTHANTTQVLEDQISDNFNFLKQPNSMMSHGT